MEYKHYVVCLDAATDGEHEFEIIGVYHNPKKAKDVFEAKKAEEQENVEGNNLDIIEEDDTSFSAYLDGNYDSDHIDIFIKTVEADS